MSAPAPFTLTVGELAGMLAGLDPAAFSNVVALRRDAGQVVQYQFEVFDPMEEAAEKLQELKKQIRRNEHALTQINADFAQAQKRLAKIRRVLASIAKLKAAKRLPLP